VKILWRAWYFSKPSETKVNISSPQTNGSPDVQEGEDKSIYQNQTEAFHRFLFISVSRSLLWSFTNLEPQRPATLVFHFKCQPPCPKQGRKKGSQHLAQEWSYICSRVAGCWPRPLLTLVLLWSSRHSPWIHFSIPFLFQLGKPLHYRYKDGKDTSYSDQIRVSQESESNANDFWSSPLFAKPPKWSIPTDRRESKSQKQFFTAKLKENSLLPHALL